MANLAHCIAAVSCLLSLAACADLTTHPETLTREAPAGDTSYRLQGAVTGAPSGGRSRTLAQGSIWQSFGTVPEGTIYRPVGTILTAEAMNVHEAYIVVHDGTWVGFWLPAENAFVTIATPVTIGLTSEK